MEMWDPNDWQGRSEEQVKRNAKIASWCIVGTAIAIGLIAIYYTLIGTL